jgi:transcriptional regulator with XRE-family HTH domain
VDDGWTRRPAVDDGPTLGVLIADYMARERITLQEMAQRCGVSLATVAALRAGTRGKRPHPATLVKLAAAMDVDVAALTAAVNRTLDPDRAREAALLAGFRTLPEPARRQVEALVMLLRQRPGSIVVPESATPADR